MQTGLLIAWYVMSFIFGTIIFSFLNVVIYRTPIHKSFAEGRSFCPKCGKTLKPYDMVPVFSWIFLRGKCRFCKEPISPRYPAVEALGGIFAVLCSLKYIDPIYLSGMDVGRALVAFYICSMLTVITFIDWDTMTIFDGTNLCVFFGGVISYFFFPEVSILERVIGVFCISVPMYILVCIKEGAFGGGDIKLFAALGAFFGWKMTILVFFFSVIFGGAYAIVGLVNKTKSRKQHFAFGPFICIAAVLVMMAGKEILAWYLGLYGFGK